MFENLFGKKCTLCGGKLNSDSICTECGLDNRKNDRNYQLNQHDHDHVPLTHVHDDETGRPMSVEQMKREQTRKSGQKPPVQSYSPASRQKTSRRAKQGSIGRSLITLIVVIGVLFSMMGVSMDRVFQSVIDKISGNALNIGETIGSQWAEEGADDFSDFYDDPYAWLEEELPETGESESIVLTSGNYVVGVHLPAGNYRVEGVQTDDEIEVEDPEHSIYIYETGDGELWNDLRLFPGAKVKLTAAEQLTFVTENAQTDDMNGQENPLAGAVIELGETGESVIVGDSSSPVQITPGVYDFECVSGNGYVNVTIGDSDDFDYTELDFYLDEELAGETSYKNIVLPEGAVIICDPEFQVRLRASEKIVDTDYTGYYLN